MKPLLKFAAYLPVINGLVGDKLAAKKDAWAIPMSFRLDGQHVTVDQLDRKLGRRPFLVFVHGLMADERIFKHFAGLEDEFSVLYVRYNTGLHIYENGRALAALLHELWDRFRMKKLFLAGHSMGGLVVRSAGYYATKKKYPWTEHVPAIFLIAVPNTGAVLEKIGHVAATTLNQFAKWHLGSIGNLIEQRSNGIKDLRRGFMLEEDPRDTDEYRIPVPPLPGTRYHILLGTLGPDESSLITKYFGDGLVHHSSAVAQTLIKISEVKIFPRTGHNSILSNPDVYDYLYGVLKTGKPG